MKIAPVVFSDDDTVYKEFAKHYVQHKNGLYIVAPSGAGKTHFCQNQTEKHWIDGDDLWIAAKAHPEGPWWKEPIPVMDRIDQRADVITMEAMHQGFWIMGSSTYWLKPSAIVIPDWETHKEYIAARHHGNYDGGATPEDHSQVLGHIEFIKTWHTDHGVPLFSSIEDAVKALTS